jgi:hypothetical protein
MRKRRKEQEKAWQQRSSSCRNRTRARIGVRKMLQEVEPNCCSVGSELMLRRSFAEQPVERKDETKLSLECRA